jgi:hypothetical protein
LPPKERGSLASFASDAPGTREERRLGVVFERFTERARQVVVLAQDEARALKHNYIGTEHILLGLLREEEGLAARVLESLKITTEEVRAQVARIIGTGDEPVVGGQIPFTPRAKKVLELSLREAMALRDSYIGTEHILLGIARENEGVASRILLDFGVDAEKIRDATIRVVPGHFPGGYPDRPLPRPERSTKFPHPVIESRPGQDNATLMIAGASIATAGLGIGLALGWLIWG